MINEAEDPPGESIHGYFMNGTGKGEVPHMQVLVVNIHLFLVSRYLQQNLSKLLFPPGN